MKTEKSQYYTQTQRIGHDDGDADVVVAVSAFSKKSASLTKTACSSRCCLNEPAAGDADGGRPTYLL